MVPTNDGIKSEIRAYQAAHPGMKYNEAARQLGLRGGALLTHLDVVPLGMASGPTRIFEGFEPGSSPRIPLAHPDDNFPRRISVGGLTCTGKTMMLTALIQSALNQGAYVAHMDRTAMPVPEFSRYHGVKLSDPDERYLYLGSPWRGDILDIERALVAIRASKDADRDLVVVLDDMDAEFGAALTRIARSQRMVIVQGQHSGSMSDWYTAYGRPAGMGLAHIQMIRPEREDRRADERGIFDKGFNMAITRTDTMATTLHPSVFVRTEQGTR